MIYKKMSGNLKKTRFVAAVGAWIDVACSIVKVTVGFISGSYALVADAAHSATDFVTDLAVVFGVKYWSAPPDDGHPYGHGKIESLVVLFMSAALFAAAGCICYAAFRCGSVPDPLAGVVALWTAVIKAGLAIWTFYAAALAGSSALEANAWHHMSDALSSIPVTVAVFVSFVYPQLAWLDSAAAVLVAAIVAKTAWSFAKSAVMELVDADVPGMSDAVTKLATCVPGVNSVHKTRVRKYGGSFHADLHVQVDPEISVRDGHGIAHSVKDRIVSERPDVLDVVVHVEPYFN